MLPKFTLNVGMNPDIPKTSNTPYKRGSNPTLEITFEQPLYNPILLTKSMLKHPH